VGKNQLLDRGYRLVSTNKIGIDIWGDIAKLCRQKEGVVLDIGGHEGGIVPLICAALPNVTIYSFEPCQKTWDTLSKNIRQWRNVMAVHSVVGDKEGVVELQLTEHSATNSLLKPSELQIKYSPEGWSESAGVEQVPSTTVDAFCEKNNIAQLLVLKADVQGAELQVLHGAEKTFARRAVEFVVLEVSGKRLYEKQPVFSEILTYLETKGYGLVNLYDVRPDWERGEMIQADALFRSISR